MRNGTIDFFRFIFAVGIVMYHARPLFSEDLFVCGYIGVEFFFIVSGYLLMKKATVDADKAERNLRAGRVFEDNLSMIFHKMKHILPFLAPAMLCAFVFRYAFSDGKAEEMLYDLLYSVAELTSVQMFGFENGALIDAAWYLSALFIVSFILYPILRTHEKLFTLYVAPLIVLFIYGFFSRTLNGAMNIPFHWYGICFKGLLRGLAGMSLGCISYVLAKRLAEWRKRRRLLTTVEFAGYVTAIVYLIFWPMQTGLDFLITAILFCSVTISFSGISCLSGVFDRWKFCVLGEFSLSVFLSHSYVRENIRRLFGKMVTEEGEMICLYLVIVFLLSLGNFLLGQQIEKHICQYKGGRMFLQR